MTEKGCCASAGGLSLGMVARETNRGLPTEWSVNVDATDPWESRGWELGAGALAGS